MTKVVAIASPKGGVGKTTMAINLASAMGSFGRVCLAVDADLQSPNLAMHLGSPSLPVTIHHVLKGEAPVSKAIYLHPSGVRVLPGSIRLADCQQAKPEDLHLAIDAARSHADMILLDCPPGLGKECRSALACADAVLCVTTPDLVAVTDAIRVVKIAQYLQKDIFGVAVNQFLPHSELSLHNVASLMELPVLGAIPYDPAIIESLRIHHPVVFSHPDAISAQRFKELAALLLGDTYITGLHQKK